MGQYKTMNIGRQKKDNGTLSPPPPKHDPERLYYNMNAI